MIIFQFETDTFLDKNCDYPSMGPNQNKKNGTTLHINTLFSKLCRFKNLVNNHSIRDKAGLCSWIKNVIILQWVWIKSKKSAPSLHINTLFSKLCRF